MLVGGGGDEAIISVRRSNALRLIKGNAVSSRVLEAVALTSTNGDGKKTCVAVGLCQIDIKVNLIIR